MLQETVKILTATPEKLDVEKVIDILSEDKELDYIMEILVKKFEYLSKKTKENQHIIVVEGTLHDITDEYKGLTKTILTIISEIYHEIKHYGNKDKSFSPTITETVKKIFSPIGKFSLEELDIYKYNLVNIICSSDVRFLHEILFDHLTHFKLMDIKNIKSPYVEEYLRRNSEESENSNKYLEALYKHYITCGEYHNALKIIKSNIFL